LHNRDADDDQDYGRGAERRQTFAENDESEKRKQHECPGACDRVHEGQIRERVCARECGIVDQHEHCAHRDEQPSGRNRRRHTHQCNDEERREHHDLDDFAQTDEGRAAVGAFEHVVPVGM
jgi:hypothetical protein